MDISIDISIKMKKNIEKDIWDNVPRIDSTNNVENKDSIATYWKPRGLILIDVSKDLEKFNENQIIVAVYRFEITGTNCK